MTYEADPTGQGGLRFFGKMTASISHEVKNVLSIINESAGLLDDLTVLAEKGMPLDPARLKTQAARILKQIQRADGIIKLMNRFAHSVDESEKSVDLFDMVELIAGLSARFASVRGVELAAVPPKKPITVLTNPFLLQHALWVCLDFVMDQSGKGQKVVLGLDEDENWARVHVTAGPGVFKGSPGTPFTAEREGALIRALGAEIEVDEAKGEAVLNLPLGPPAL